jgi:C-methyltransferase
MSQPDAAAFATVMKMRQLAISAAFAGALRAGTRLGLADAIDDTPRSVSELAAAVNAEPDALERLLRALAAHGVFAADDQGRYGHTDLSRLLRLDAPRSLYHMVCWATEPWTWAVWGELETAVRTGKGVFEERFGKEFFTYLHEDAPESAAVFDKAMTESSVLSAQNVAQSLDLRGAGTVADIAGGQGYVLATLLERFPEVRGTLLDLPDVVANADARLRPGGALAERATLLPGDCRQSVGVQADVYVLKNILEWDDDSTVTALRNVRAAAAPGARVVVIENLVDGSPEMRFTTAMDLLLLLNVGGKKHTKDGLAALMRKAGLDVFEIKPIGPYLHVFDSVVPKN